jgi:hypothetical protein
MMDAACGAIEALKVLKARYFYYLDHKEWDNWRSVFVEDAVMDVSAHFPDAHDPSIHVLKGADRIVNVVSSTVGETVTVHHGHSPIITVDSADEASGIWALEDNLFMPDGSRLTGYGHYHERYRRIGGEWRIGHTRLTRLKMLHTPPEI